MTIPEIFLFFDRFDACTGLCGVCMMEGKVGGEECRIRVGFITSHQTRRDGRHAKVGKYHSWVLATDPSIPPSIPNPFHTAPTPQIPYSISPSRTDTHSIPRPMPTPLMTPQLIPSQEPLCAIIRTSRGPAIKLPRIRVVFLSMALEIGGAREGAAAAGEGAGKAGRGAGGMEWSDGHVVAGDGDVVGDGEGIVVWDGEGVVGVVVGEVGRHMQVETVHVGEGGSLGSASGEQTGVTMASVFSFSHQKKTYPGSAAVACIVYAPDCQPSARVVAWWSMVRAGARRR